MSVLKSKRNLSRHEYVRTFEKLYNYTFDRTKKVARRKYQWIAMPIMNSMNNIYNMIMQSNNDYFMYGIKMLDKESRASLIINELTKLQKPLLAFWNIERCETKRMVTWSNMINEEIVYVYKLISGKEYSMKNIFILDYKAVNETDFIGTMSELHRMIYSKMISLPNAARNTKGLLLMDLADEALYRICKANRYVPINTKMVYDRKKDLSLALEALYEMQQPMFSIFNLMHYSENTMIELSSKLEKEIRLIKGVMKSDVKRFSDL